MSKFKCALANSGNLVSKTVFLSSTYVLLELTIGTVAEAALVI